MTRELIEEFRSIVIPYMVNRFKEINYEGKGDFDAEEFKSDFNEICDLAIKALEQESSNSGKPNNSTSKNDLGVDWDELKRKIFMEVDGGTDDKWLRYVDVCENISKSIDEFKADLPQATPIRPKGHWIKGYTYPDGEYWKCDKCNELIKVKYPMHYCNNCGSDNREVEE